MPGKMKKGGMKKPDKMGMNMPMMDKPMMGGKMDKKKPKRKGK